MKCDNKGGKGYFRGHHMAVISLVKRALLSDFSIIITREASNNAQPNANEPRKSIILGNLH